jgi:hypothetical protein
MPVRARVYCPLSLSLSLSLFLFLSLSCSLCVSVLWTVHTSVCKLPVYSSTWLPCARARELSLSLTLSFFAPHFTGGILCWLSIFAALAGAVYYFSKRHVVYYTLLDSLPQHK